VIRRARDNMQGHENIPINPQVYTYVYIWKLMANKPVRMLYFVNESAKPGCIGDVSGCLN